MTYESGMCFPGLTPPTTPPHKPVEDELFKGESPPKGSWLTRAHSRKLPEQTELYAQLRKMGQATDSEPKGVIYRTFGDHDYCLLSLGESRKRTAAMLSPSLCRTQEGPEPKGELVESRLGQQDDSLFSTVPEYLSTAQSKEEGRRVASPPSASPHALSPHNSEEEGERSSPSRSPSPILHSGCCQPHSPISGCENSETCHGDKQRNKTKSGPQIDEVNVKQRAYTRLL